MAKPQNLMEQGVKYKIKKYKRVDKETVELSNQSTVVKKLSSMEFSLSRLSHDCEARWDL